MTRVEPARPVWKRVGGRRLASALIIALAASLPLLTMATPAYAAADRIDALTIDYRMDTAGVLHVQERFVWRFGHDSGRHGIQRTLTTREPDPDTGQDIAYTIDNFDVSSPDPGVSTDVTTIADGGPLDRDRSTTYRIGDPDETILDDTATYEISYQVRGAMRHSNSYDELYWDATGFGNPEIGELSITAAVPGGAQDLRCYAGPVGGTTDCDTARRADGVATFEHRDLPAAHGATIGVKIGSGLVADNAVHLVPRAGLSAVITSPAYAVPGGIALLLTVLIPIIAMLLTPRLGVDRRYLDLAPGAVPDDGTTARIGKADPGLEIPVRFTPPDLPVAQAGMLSTGAFEARHTAATLIALAVAGAVRIWTRYENMRGFTAELLDRSKATSPEGIALLEGLFPEGDSEQAHRVSSKGAMAEPHKSTAAATRLETRRQGWYHIMPAESSGIPGRLVAALVIAAVIFVVAVVLMVLWSFGAIATAFPIQICFVSLPLLALAITTAMARRRLRTGRRSAQGRAICDQVQGFRQYLATAEAEQLRFEEGEDIYSRYLPWAITFDLANRWQTICRDLVEEGRLPDATPAWFSNGSNDLDDFSAFNIATFAGTMPGASEPPKAPRSGSLWSSSGSSGSGFGSSGSSFSSGGGFSGGGGGGGGSSSW